MSQAAWRIAAPSARLRKKPFAARVLDEDLVLFRDGQGIARALVDRCSHRGVQLSKGTVQGGTLRCAYHGWRYDGSGRCTEIPSLRTDQRIPSGIQVGTFPCVERDSYVWVWTGNSDPATAAPLPIPGVEKGPWVQSTILMDCHWLKPIENNVDPTHAAFTHAWTHPQWFQRRFRGLREDEAEVRLTEHGFALWTPATTGPEDPIPAVPSVKTEFDLPDRVTVSFAKPYRQVIVLHAIPTGPNSCRLETLVKLPFPMGRRIRFSNWEHPIFRQDRVVMESAESWTRRIGHDFERSVEADYSMLLARRVAELAEAGLWQEKRASLTQRRILAFRA